jgi:hypothetical protein
MRTAAAMAASALACENGGIERSLGGAQNVEFSAR